MSAFLKMLGAWWGGYIDQTAQTEKFALIDIGWQGTSQCMLAQMFPQYDILGLYYAVLNEKHPEYKKLGFINGLEKNFNNHVANAGFLFENIFLPPIGQVKSYRENYEGNIEPNLADGVIHNTTVEELQREVEDFVKDIRKYPYISVPTEKCISEMYKTIDKPSKKMADALGDIRWTDDGKTIRYVARPTEDLRPAIFHIRKFLRELKGSGWRTGFLLRTFKIPCNYYYIVTLMRRIMR